MKLRANRVQKTKTGRMLSGVASAEKGGMSFECKSSSDKAEASKKYAIVDGDGRKNNQRTGVVCLRAMGTCIIKKWRPSEREKIPLRDCINYEAGRQRGAILNWAPEQGVRLLERTLERHVLLVQSLRERGKEHDRETF